MINSSRRFCASPFALIVGGIGAMGFAVPSWMTVHLPPTFSSTSSVGLSTVASRCLLGNAFRIATRIEFDVSPKGGNSYVCAACETSMKMIRNEIIL